MNIFLANKFVPHYDATAFSTIEAVSKPQIWFRDPDCQRDFTTELLINGTQQAQTDPESATPPAAG
jgi:hypothetical protein